MTSILGALWTGLQSMGWLLCFLRQLISDTLNINYRLVSTVGHLIVGIAKILYTMLNSVGLAAYETVSYMLLTVAAILSFIFECLYFVIHCCTLLFKVIYYTLTGVANGLVFALLMPICACQSIHSWMIWIFNTERWLNAVVWCLLTFSSAFSLVGENTWWLILYSVITVNSWISTVATYAYEHMMMSCATIYTGVLTLCAAVTGGIAFILFHIWSFVMLPFDFLYDLLTLLEDSGYRLLQLCSTNYACLIPISLSVFLTLFICGSRLARLLRMYFRHSMREVIRINLNDVDDVIEVSDDEQDDFRGHAANIFHFAGDDEGEDSEDTDVDVSTIADSTDETSDDTNINTDSDSDDSDRATIDVQLPDQPSSLASGRHHGYATRSKGNVSQLQQHLDQERERSLCVICQDQMKSVLVLPCRHMCMCVDCARTVVSGAHGQRRICPLCRGDIRIVMNVYT